MHINIELDLTDNFGATFCKVQRIRPSQTASSTCNNSNSTDEAKVSHAFSLKAMQLIG